MKLSLLTGLFCLYSLSAVAGYECSLKLSHTDDLDKVIAEKMVTVETGKLKSGSFGTLFIESQSKRKKISLDLNAVISGLKGEEDITFAIMNQAQTLRKDITIQGDDKIVEWVDSYKLDVACGVKA